MKVLGFTFALLCLVASCSPYGTPTNSKEGILAAYDPILIAGTLPGTRLDGRVKVDGDWAFFLGSTVDASGQQVTPPDGISSDTVILFGWIDEGWRVIDHGLGISDAYYFAWVEEYGVPKSLLMP